MTPCDMLTLNLVVDGSLSMVLIISYFIMGEYNMSIFRYCFGLLGIIMVAIVYMGCMYPMHITSEHNVGGFPPCVVWFYRSLVIYGICKVIEIGWRGANGWCRPYRNR
jgi:hypothetical protein